MFLARRLSVYCAVAVLGGVLASAPRALAAAATLHAYEDVEAENQFTLHFFGDTPDQDIVTTSKVVATRLSLDVNEENGTARFTDYYQIVEPLTLPLGISTGNITVQIKTSSGTYDRNTGDFTTHDEYEISFTNDLSFFGFTSPVTIPSESKGNLNGGVSARSIGMTWEGKGELQNSQDPSNPFKYTYVCTSTSKIGDPLTFPPLPALSSSAACGAGACGVTGFAPMLAFAMGLALMKINVSRRRRHR